jgi:hypothetical protein
MNGKGQDQDVDMARLRFRGRSGLELGGAGRHTTVVPPVVRHSNFNVEEVGANGADVAR